MFKNKNDVGPKRKISLDNFKEVDPNEKIVSSGFLTYADFNANKT